MKISMSCLALLTFCLTSSVCFSQNLGIALNEVEVVKDALPVIEIDNQEYSFRERDYFVQLLLRTRFWNDSFKLKVDLESFYTDSLFSYQMTGKTNVYIDTTEIKKKHAYKTRRAIRKLNAQIKKIRIEKEKGNQVIKIITTHTKPKLPKNN